MQRVRGGPVGSMRTLCYFTKGTWAPAGFDTGGGLCHQSPVDAENSSVPNSIFKPLIPLRKKTFK